MTMIGDDDITGEIMPCDKMIVFSQGLVLKRAGMAASDDKDDAKVCGGGCVVGCARACVCVVTASSPRKTKSKVQKDNQNDKVCMVRARARDTITGSSGTSRSDPQAEASMTRTIPPRKPDACTVVATLKLRPIHPSTHPAYPPCPLHTPKPNKPISRPRPSLLTTSTTTPTKSGSPSASRAPCSSPRSGLAAR